MDYKLPDDLQTFADKMISSGKYRNIHELILHAVYLHRDREQSRREKHDALKQDIQVGIDQLNRDEGIDGEVVFDRLLKRLETNRSGSST